MDGKIGDYILSLISLAQSHRKNEELLYFLFNQLDAFECYQLYKQIKDNESYRELLTASITPNYWTLRIKQFLRTYHHFDNMDADLWFVNPSFLTLYKLVDLYKAMTGREKDLRFVDLTLPLAGIIQPEPLQKLQSLPCLLSVEMDETTDPIRRVVLRNRPRLGLNNPENDDTTRRVIGKRFVCFYSRWHRGSNDDWGFFLQRYKLDDYLKIYKMSNGQNGPVIYTPVRFSPPYGFHPRNAKSFYVELYEPFLIIVSGTESFRRNRHPFDEPGHRRQDERPFRRRNFDEDDLPDESQIVIFIIYLNNPEITEKFVISD